MIEGYSYITNESSIEEACKQFVLSCLKKEIPAQLIGFMDHRKIVEEVLYCEIVISNNRVIFISEEKVENMTFN